MADLPAIVKERYLELDKWEERLFQTVLVLKVMRGVGQITSSKEILVLRGGIHQRLKFTIYLGD